MPTRAAILALGDLLSLAAVGCGTSDRASDAATVAERFHAALERGDREEMPCEEAVLGLDLPRGGAAARPRRPAST